MQNILAGKPGFKECSGANALLDRLSGTCLPVLLGLVAAFAGSAYLGIYWDNDILYIISLGRSIISDGIPWTDPLTCNEGLDCIAQQWLFCVATAALYDAGGKAAVCAAIGMLWAACAIVVWRCMLAFVPERPRACAIGCGLALFGMCMFIKTNPRMLDVACLMLSAAAMEKRLRGGGRGWLACPAACSALMANLHCTMWVLAAAPAFLALFDGRARGKRRGIAAALAAACAASALSPYGIYGSLYIFASLGGRYPRIGELQPITLSPSSAILAAVPLLIALYIYLRAPRLRTGGDVRLLGLLMAGVSVLAMMQIRNCLLLLPVAATAFAWSSDAICRAKPALRERMRRYLMLAAAAAAAILILFWLLIPQNPDTELMRSRSEAMAALKAAGLEEGSSVGNRFNSGGFQELNGMRPWLDERAELMLPEINGRADLVAESEKLADNGQWAMDEWVASHDFDSLWLESSATEADEFERMSDAAEKHGYREVYSDENVTAWIKG